MQVPYGALLFVKVESTLSAHNYGMREEDGERGSGFGKPCLTLSVYLASCSSFRMIKFCTVSGIKSWSGSPYLP